MNSLIIIGSSAGKESACNAGDPGSITGLGRSTGDGIGYPLQYSDLENSRFMGLQRVRQTLTNFPFHFLFLLASLPGQSDLLYSELVAYTVKHLPAIWETHVQSLGREDPLEKEMATHSSILAWKIPWTEEPGGLQSMGSQRVGHN